MKNTAVGIFFIDSDHNHVISNRFPYKSDIAAHRWDKSAQKISLHFTRIRHCGECICRWVWSFAQLECFDVTWNKFWHVEGFKTYVYLITRRLIRTKIKIDNSILWKNNTFIYLKVRLYICWMLMIGCCMTPFIRMGSFANRVDTQGSHQSWLLARNQQ